MNIEDFYSFCMGLKGTEETFPFDQQTLVFKVGGKMYALADVEQFSSVNLKCDPERAIELRERFSAIRPGWHMNKTHWNTVQLHNDVDDLLLKELIQHSYTLVVASLPKKVRNEIEMG